MRKLMITALMIGVGTAIAMPAPAATAKTKRIQVAQPTFDQCYALALRRGINVSRGDRWIKEKFIADCMAGKIPF